MKITKLTVLSKEYMVHTFLVLLISLPSVVFGADFQPLIGIPGFGDDYTSGDFNRYINTLYALSISIAALLAVIKIVVAGVKWMLSDVVTSKQDAKKDIQGALIGLLIVISAVLILTVINPALTKLTFDAPFVGEVVTRETQERDPSRIASDPPDCPPGQRLNVDSSGSEITYSCEPLGDTPTTDTGLIQVRIDYICPAIRESAGCITNFDYDKSQAEFRCENTLNGELTDDPATIGRGICTYERSDSDSGT
jgi:hypothetical protein